ncbi:hypothetical protein EWB00_008438 [Schistosoma japonicum]|uniref:RRM domain-containing protein n=2 Tax=Schistosoma japonicum TaxID=6182 RepID=A0A4Z2CQE1_SCHJA|nr:hypothetical protein EWB00_008438 [Schistosoma japonicum]
MVSLKRIACDDVASKSTVCKHSKKSKSIDCLSTEVSENGIDLNKSHQTWNFKKGDFKDEMPNHKSKKKLLKNSISGIGELTNGIPKLLITSLPCHMSTTALKDIFPTVVNLKMRKTAGSKHAVLDFSCNEDYLDAVNRLKSIEFDGVKPNYRAVVGHTENAIQSNLSKQFVNNNPNCLILRNLPYSLTATEIKEHFPLADRIHLDVNKFGIFNGSCILVMKSKEDLEIVLDKCKHKYINNRLVRVNLQSESKLESSKHHDSTNMGYGLKLKEVPNIIEDEHIKALFPQTSLIGLSSRIFQDSNTRNVFIFFKKNSYRKSALKMFKTEVVLGHPISCRLWVPSNRRCKSQTAKINMEVNNTVLNNKMPKPNEFSKNEKKLNLYECRNASSSSSIPKKIVFDSDNE